MGLILLLILLIFAYLARKRRRGSEGRQAKSTWNLRLIEGRGNGEEMQELSFSEENFPGKYHFPKMIDDGLMMDWWWFSTIDYGNVQLQGKAITLDWLRDETGMFCLLLLLFFFFFFFLGGGDRKLSESHSPIESAGYWSGDRRRSMFSSLCLRYANILPRLYIFFLFPYFVRKLRKGAGGKGKITLQAAALFTSLF